MYDVVFMHPPLSFLKIRYPLSGLFESATGTTDLLTMMPVGMLSMANELDRNGYRILIVNIAKKLLEIRNGSNEKIEDYIKQFPSKIYAIDLHWAAHTPGAIDLAKMCKEESPDSFVLLGGLTSTRFHEEILANYSFVDAIVLGECDGLIGSIVESILATPRRIEQAPNLAFRSFTSIIKTPRQSPDLTKIDYVDSSRLIRPEADAKRLDRESLIFNIPVVRGCNQECLFCGGSKSAYSKSFNRPGFELVQPSLVIQQVQKAVEGGARGVKFFGDIRLGGAEYVRTLLEGIKKLPEMDVALELFWLASVDFLESWRKATRNLYVSISPESSHSELRKLHGKPYDNATLIEQAQICQKLDITTWFWFVYLLPGHTQANLNMELELLEKLVEVGTSISVNIQPYLFIDPASAIFEQPKKYGFDLTMANIAQLKKNLERPYWFYSIGYRTGNFTELEYFYSILDVTLNEAKIFFKHKRLSGHNLLKTFQNLECQRKMGKLIENEPNLSDEVLQNRIEGIFPEYLMRSNASLLIWPFFGESIVKPSSPESMVFDAFPTALELILRSKPDTLADVYMDIVVWNKEHQSELQDVFKSRALKESLKSLVLKLLAPLRLPLDFTGQLLEFEWDVFRLLCFSKPEINGNEMKDGLIIKQYGYDMIVINDLVERIVERKQNIEIQQTFYLFNLIKREVFVMNYDPFQIKDKVGNVRIYKMSTLERTFIYAERLVVQVISGMMKQKNPQMPTVLVDGEEMSAKQIWELLDVGKQC